jgi:hypothetical protein
MLAESREIYLKSYKVARVSIYTAHGANKKHARNFACKISNEVENWEIREQMKILLYCALQEQVMKSKYRVKWQ